MAQMEDQLQALENQKWSHDIAAAKSPTRASPSPRELLTSPQQERYPPVITSTKSDNSNTTLTH